MTNQFTSSFGDGGSGYVLMDDVIETEPINGIVYKAQVKFDDITKPGEHDEAFWPRREDFSSEQEFLMERARSEAIKKAWDNNEWCYCGIVVSGYLPITGGLFPLVEHAAACWGIDCNFPPSPTNPTPNSYLTEVANDLLSDAQVEAEDQVERILAHLNTFHKSATPRDNGTANKDDRPRK